MQALHFVTVSAAALIVAQPAAAQGPAQGDESPAAGQAESNDGEIVVTAQFREQRLQDTPIAITAMTGEQLETKGLTSVADVAATAPNVNLTQGSSAYGSGMTAYIRGIGQYDTNFALEPGVGMYIDDVYHGVLVGSMFDLLDLDRVEVLRGPQGTLAGKNSIGGAIKLYSRKPEGSNTGYIQGTYGSFDRIDVRGAFDFALADNLSARFSAFSKYREGHVKLIDFACDQPALAGTIPSSKNGPDCEVGTLGGTQTWGVRLALRYQPSDALEINIAGAIVRDDSEAPGVEQANANNAAAPTLGGVPYDSRFVPTRPYINYGAFLVPQTGWKSEPVAQTDSESISARIDWKPSENFQLTSITAYENIYGQYSFDGDGSPIGLTLTYGFQPYHQFTQELRLNGEFGDGLVETTVGGFYFDSKGRVGARVWSAPVLNFIQDDPVTNKSRSVFGHVIVHPVEAMSLIGGLRYTDDKKVYQFTRADPTTGAPPPVVGPLNGVTAGYTGDSIDWRLGLDYRFSPEVMVYASASTGYKGGGVNPRPFIPAQAVPFGSESVTAYELGIKTDLFDRVLRLNTSAFLNKYSDIILIDANGFPGAPGDPAYFPLSAVPFNAGDADIKGIELEAELHPAGGFSLSGSVSYLDFEYKSLDANATASGIGAASVAPFTSKWKWSASASYEFDLGNGATLTPQIFADYQSSYFTDPVNAATNLIEGRTLVNANVRFKSADGDWELTGGVTNLGDKHYYINAFDIVATNGTSSKVVGRPREFYLTLKRNF
ncbi:TonB-dependent receptor [Sphingomonas canadensis]|uniref:TonB-dependent receptor n=1 Tax=Sphingomonas canadensis TaxID=1219257 RepID=A0ABW3HDD4_9SPHN|nr:TonB-dependent receptor [Sphingomonas canadensis]MCW3838340.1 TonB-dependent receptor [Sphingomonas canadensis]